MILLLGYKDFQLEVRPYLKQKFDDEPAFIVELAKEEKRNVRAALISPF